MDEAKRFNVCVCGRRFGKSTLGLDQVIQPALQGQPTAWFAPGYEPMNELWRYAMSVLAPVTTRASVQEHRIDLITGGVLELWSLNTPDAARGHKYARVVIDEAAMVPGLMDAWNAAIRPTLADYQGDAWFLSTPRGYNDYHTLYQYGQSPDHPDWMSWQMPTHTNPYIRPDELVALERGMVSRVYRQEILAQFEAENEGALWSRQWIDDHRLTAGQKPELVRVVVAIDPSGSKRGDAVGIVVAGIDRARHLYVLDDLSGQLGPDEWARRALRAYADHKADRIVAEANFGGEMVEHTLAAAAREEGLGKAPVLLVSASRGKVVRAEPIAVMYRNGEAHHVGLLPDLENELCNWTPLQTYSPGRLDALVWAATDLALGAAHPYSYAANDPAFRASVLGPAEAERLAARKRALGLT